MFSQMNKYTAPQADNSVLLTIDMQNDFVQPGAPAEGKGAAEAAVRIGEMVQQYRKAALPIVHIVRMYDVSRGPETIDACRRQAMEEGTPLLVPHSDGVQLVPEIAIGQRLDEDLLFSGKPQWITGNECIVYKPRWGAFYDTALDALLKKQSVTTLSVCGTWFSNCVRTTIYEATAMDYRVVALWDAIAGIYARGEDDLRKIQCGVCTCAEWMEYASF